MAVDLDHRAFHPCPLAAFLSLPLNPLECAKSKLLQQPCHLAWANLQAAKSEGFQHKTLLRWLINFDQRCPSSAGIHSQTCRPAANDLHINSVSVHPVGINGIRQSLPTGRVDLWPAKEKQNYFRRLLSTQLMGTANSYRG